MNVLARASGTPKAVLGARIDPVDLPATLLQIDGFLRGTRAVKVHLMNANNFVLAATDSVYQATLNAGDLNLPDGWPAVWASRLLGGRLRERVAGADLCEAVFEWGVDRGIKHFFYGSTSETLARLVTRVRARHAGINIVGTHAPPFRALTPQEADDIVGLIDSTGADLVWVGLGTPKQDYWIRDFSPRLSNAKVLIAVGAAFDFLAAEKKRAPLWMQRSGLEWLHRLLSEPRRLWRRYVLGIPQFLFLFSNQFVRERLLGRRREEGENPVPFTY